MTEEQAEQPATRRDVEDAAKGDRLVTWLSGGLGALVSVVGVCGILLGAALVTIDRSEAAGLRGAASVKADLDEHKRSEAEHHQWTQTMLFRQDAKTDAVLVGLHIPNPTPTSPPAPPPLDLPLLDAGP